jgi:uncharacterized protein
MGLKPAERQMMINQCRILEKLYPDEASDYATFRKALESGFALEYESRMTSLEDELPYASCREVLDIMNMYRHLAASYEKLPDRSGIDVSAVTFPGFDGNAETAQLLYAQYYVTDLGRFKELAHLELNSHTTMLPKYRTMLNVWREFPGRRLLEKAEIKRILEG